MRLFSFGGYGLAFAALALIVVFGAYDSYSNYPCNLHGDIQADKSILLKILERHRHMDIHLYIFNKLMIRHGYRMDTSTRAIEPLGQTTAGGTQVAPKIYSVV